MFLYITWTTAVSHTTAVPHSSYHLLCMVEWSLGGHCCVCINHSAQNFKGWLTKTLKREDISNFINICRTNSIQALNLRGFLCRFWLCHSNDILKSKEKIAVGTGVPFQRQEVSGNKANAKLVNHIQPQLSRLCQKSSWTPISQNADGAPPYWGFQRCVTYVWPTAEI